MKMIGDVLTSSILFEALRKEFPKADLHYLIYKHTSPVIHNNPNIDKLIFADDGFRQTLKKVKSENYSAVIDVFSNFKTALITGFSRAKFRTAYDKYYTRPLNTHVFSRKIEAETNAGAAIEKRMRLLSPLSANFPTEIKPKIYLTEIEKQEAHDKLLEAGIDLSTTLYMVGALGSSGPKTYPLDYLAELLDEIVAKTNATLLFNYIPTQKSDIQKLYNFCKPNTQQKIQLDIYGNSLREFLAITAHCDALIGNEGGAINMAKALNIPTFAIFSPPLDKENWNIYEDGKRNVSVHLRDYKPEEFSNQSHKNLRDKNEVLYSKFSPVFILNKLNEFITANSK